MGQHSFRMIETNGITLTVVVEGDGPLLLLLHGFPQRWYLWRHQIDELVAAGYQVAVPDQRGYGGAISRQNWKPMTLRSSWPTLSGSPTRWARKHSHW
jgi:pimeloyl-ACP methyl ester carboxylesterase